MSFLRNTILAAAALLVAACSGGADPFCGDGHMDPGEQCDDGNADDTDFCLSTCKARQLSSLTVKWEFNRDAAPGFTGDSCIDVGAKTVEVELIGAPEPVALTENCSFRQVVFSDIPAGSYDVTVRVLDSEETPLTTDPVAVAYDFAGGIATTEVVVPPYAWVDDYDGTFYFRTMWGGASCQLASPEVVEQRLTLVIDDIPFEGMTVDGVALNGSSASACVSLEEEFPQAALLVPFGDATLHIEGLDSEGAIVFASEHETFVGAGLNNPELLFDVDLVTR